MTAAPRDNTPLTQPPLLQVQSLARRYRNDGGTKTAVFENVDCSVARGEFVAIVGDSGVGKSTFLNCLAGLDEWQQGRVLHAGQDLSALDETGRALWRRSHVGFVFQAFHVLPHLDVWHNVALPLMLLQRLDAAGRQRVQQLLQAVGLQGLEQRLPWQLSGGQLQRVAIARALVHGPALLLADEPTGNLDPQTAGRVFSILLQLVRASGLAALIATHNMELAARMDRRVTIRDGMIEQLA